MLAKAKSYSVEVLISKPLIDSNINNEEFVLINNILKEYEEMEEDFKHFKISIACRVFYSIYKNNVIMLLEA